MVGERESGSGHIVDVHVIQRGVSGGDDLVADVEGDVAEAESLRSFGVLGIRVFRGTKEPEEGDDGEVNDMLVGLAVEGIHGVEDREHVADDGDVCRVGTFLGVVSVPHGFEERSQ